MAWEAAIVGGHKVIASKTYVFQLHDTFKFAPFPDDADFTIDLEITIDETVESMKTKVTGEGRDNTLLKISRPLSLGNITAPSKPLLIANDDTDSYYIFFTMIIGGQRFQFVNFSYTITSRTD